MFHCPKCRSSNVEEVKPSGDCFYVAEEFGVDSEVYDAPVRAFKCNNSDENGNGDWVPCNTTFYVSTPDTLGH